MTGGARTGFQQRDIRAFRSRPRANRICRSRLQTVDRTPADAADRASEAVARGRPDIWSRLAATGTEIRAAADLHARRSSEEPPRSLDRGTTADETPGHVSRTVPASTASTNDRSSARQPTVGTGERGSSAGQIAESVNKAKAVMGAGVINGIARTLASGGRNIPGSYAGKVYLEGVIATDGTRLPQSAAQPPSAAARSKYWAKASADGADRARTLVPANGLRAGEDSPAMRKAIKTRL